ncbi:hypothetical protein ACFX13_021793 [Malus domestica]
MLASILFGRHHKAVLQSSKPKLFVMGTQDGFTSVKQLKNKLKLCSRSVETHLIDGASHFQMEGPAYDAQMELGWFTMCFRCQIKLLSQQIREKESPNRPSLVILLPFEPSTAQPSAIIAIAVFLLEQYPNRVEIVQLDDSNGEIQSDPNLSFEHPYPPTKTIFISAMKATTTSSLLLNYQLTIVCSPQVGSSSTAAANPSSSMDPSPSAAASSSSSLH